MPSSSTTRAPRGRLRGSGAARRAGVFSISLHDLGLGAEGADLVVDGSVGAPYRQWPEQPCSRAGRAMPSSDRRFTKRRSTSRPTRRCDRPRAEDREPRWPTTLAHAIGRSRRDLRVEVASGFIAAGRAGDLRPRARRRRGRQPPVPPPSRCGRRGGARGRRDAVRRLRAPARRRGLAVVEAQRTTIGAFADAGARWTPGVCGRRAPRRDSSAWPGKWWI